MKAETRQTFSPVILTLETVEEVASIFKVLQDGRDSIMRGMESGILSRDVTNSTHCIMAARAMNALEEPDILECHTVYNSKYPGLD